MFVAFIGNFEPEHSTENHVRQGLQAAGHDVLMLQEGPEAWATLGMFRGWAAPPDMVMWTRTADLDSKTPELTKRSVLGLLAGDGIPTVGYHLDRWWGLARDRSLRGREIPEFFKVALLVTADGDHDDMWESIGVNHLWMPPGVSEFECGGGTPRPEFTSDIAFVGSWQGDYHQEWQHRFQLVEHLQRVWGDRVAFWPKRGEHAIRNAPLRDLYASVKVVVGDSCLVPGVGGRRMKKYHSDRVPETLGRGGFLVHPTIDEVTDGTHYQDGVHLRTWEPGDWDKLDEIITWALDSPDERAAIAAEGRAHVLKHHSYTVRMRQLVAALDAGLLS